VVRFGDIATQKVFDGHLAIFFFKLDVKIELYTIISVSWVLLVSRDYPKRPRDLI